MAKVDEPAHSMWRTTRPYLWDALWHNRLAMLTLFFGGIVAGSVATAKSLIESALLEAFSSTLQHSADSAGWSTEVTASGGGSLLNPATWTAWLVNQTTLVGALGIYVAVTVLAFGFTVFTANARQGLSRYLFTRLHSDGLSAAFRVDSDTAMQRNEPGGLTGAVQQGASAISGGYALAASAVQYLVALLTVLWALAQTSPIISAGTVVLAFVLALCSLARGRFLRKQREAFDKRRRELFAYTDDVISNREVLLAHEQKPSTVLRLRGVAEDLATIDKSLSTKESGFSGLVDMLVDLGRFAILAVVLGVALYGTGTGAGNVGDAYFFISLFIRAMTPIQGLLHGYDEVRRSMSSSKTLVELLGRHDEDTEEGVTTVDENSPAVVLDNVTYTYPGPLGKLAVQDCSFTVPRGSVTLLVGRSGFGKTTIARLLLGFLTPQSGTVSVLGHSVADWNHKEMLDKMSYAAQTAHAIEESVRVNLFARTGTPEAKLADALVRAGLDVGLDDEAKDLSEGQMQRLALARILVDESELVILDEPLAGVDALTFAEVRSDLETWMSSPDRTVLLISHRLDFSAIATQVVVIGDHGSVEEDGPPRDLAGNGRSFSKMLSAARVDLPGT